MAYSYKSPDRDQLILLPPSVKDWLPEDHLVWVVLELVSAMDLSAFHARHPNDGVGRRAYDPEMMLALLLYGYCTGLRSSRKISQACRTDLAFKVICVDVVPEHDAVGRFRANHQAAIIDLFTEVLGVCDKAGLVSLGTIAIDGTKMAADAALEANRAEDTIRAQIEAILAEAGSADDSDSDDGHWSGPGSRLPRLRAALAEIEAERAARAEAEAEADARLAEAVRAGRRPRGRPPTDPARAVAVAAADVAVCEARAAAAKGPLAGVEALSVLGRARARFAAAEAAAVGAPRTELVAQANTTDPNSRIMKTQRRWVQGYNAQAAVTENQVIVAAVLSQDHNDVGLFDPLLVEVGRALTAAGIDPHIGTVLADAGYWSEPNATSNGPDRLIATSKDYKARRKARELGVCEGPPPPDASVFEAMEHRLRTPDGAALYAQRSGMIEPVFGNIKANRGISRFLRRGLDAVRSEWSLICTTHNINKLAVAVTTHTIPA